VFFSMVHGDIGNACEYEALFNGVEIIRQEYIDRCKHLGIPFTFIKKAPGKHIRFFYRIFRAIKRSDADIVFIHGGVQFPPVWLANFASIKNKKIIIRETQAIHLKSAREKVALRMAMRMADKIVFLSQEYASEIKGHFGKKYNAAKVCVIPNGIDLQIFCPGKHASKAGKIILGMQSRIVPIKDHITLLDSLVLLKEKFPQIFFELQIAGDGESVGSLKAHVKTVGIEDNVIFLGMLPESGLPHFLLGLDVYIHASFGETMSTAIMQAMACGKAIVASNVAGINNMIMDNNNGLLVAVTDSSAMANAIAMIVEDGQLKEKLEHNALLYAQDKFSDRRMFLDYQAVFLGVNQ